MSYSGIVLGALFLAAACRGGGWEVTEDRRVEGLANEVTIWAEMTVGADSGPRGKSAELTLWCKVPSDPATHLAVMLRPPLTSGDYGMILVRSRIDTGPIAEDTWFGTSDGKTAIPREFDQNARYRFTDALWHAHTYRLDFPFGESRGVFRFPTGGFDRAYADLKGRCKPH
jgi:hypothetical protein